MRGLTPKQRRFCEEYLIDLNAKQAAIRTGYSPRTAEQQGSRLLSNVKVQTKIDELKKQRSERTRIEADRVVKEFARLAFYDPREVMDWGPDGVRIKASGELSEDAARIVASISESPSQWGWRRQVKFADRIRALELLGKHLGIFTDKFQMSSPGDGPISFIEIVPTERQDESDI
jgi:phage terminase small subunit